MSLSESIKAELILLCPGFAAIWGDEGALWSAEDGSFTVHAVFMVFSHYIADRLTEGVDPDLWNVFAYVESKVTNDGSEVDNAVCTCFLENLMGRVPETIPPRRIVPLLGPRSLEFCRAWVGADVLDGSERE